MVATLTRCKQVLWTTQITDLTLNNQIKWVCTFNIHVTHVKIAVKPHTGLEAGHAEPISLD